MAKYRIDTNQGAFEIEADREPTTQDVEAYMAQQEPAAPENKMAQSTAAEPWKPYFNSKEEYDAAVARQGTDDTESLSAKAGMAGRALASGALRVGLPAAAVAAAPVTGGASLAAIGGLAGAAGEFLGSAVAGEEASAGDIAAAGIMGAIPGGNMAKATTGQMVKEGVKQGLGNVAASAAQSYLSGREMTGADAAMAFAGGASSAPASRFLGGAGTKLTEEQVNNAQRDAVNRAWRAAGGVIDPGAVDKGITGLQTLAGKEGIKQTASIRNSLVTTRIIRKELGLGDNAKPISIDDIDFVRAEAGKSYDEVAKLSKQAASDLENLKQARFNAKELGAAYKNTGNPAARQPWLDAKQTAQNLEDLIERHAMQAGKPDLVKQLRKNRTRIAQSYDVETALNPSNGQVDAAILAAGYNGRNMTGGLKLVADVANTFPQYVVEKSRIGAPAVSRLGAYAGAQAVAQGTPVGMLAAGIPALGGPARKFILSDVVQNWAARNPAETLPESVRQAMVRFSTLSAGRKVATSTPADGFLPEGQPVTTPQPASGQTTYTDEHGNTYPIRDVPGMGRGVVIENKFYPVID